MDLVIGGTGMLGSYLLLYLVRSGNNVRALKRYNSDIRKTFKVFSYYSEDPDELFSRIEWTEGDMLDYSSLNEAMTGIDHVYHAAGMVSFSPSEKAEIMQVNVEGTTNIVDASLSCNIKKLCFVSSIAALGITENGEGITENTKWKYSKDESAYSISKYNAELEIWRGITCGLDAIIVNPSVILGCGDWSAGSPRLFSLVWKGLKFYTLGVTGFVDARDVSMSMIKLMESEIKNEKFILSSENLSFKDIFDKIAANSGRSCPKIYVSRLVSEVMWRVESARSFITGSTPLISKSTARISHKKLYYSNKKITEYLDFEFIPVKETIEHIGKIFLKER